MARPGHRLRRDLVAGRAADVRAAARLRRRHQARAAPRRRDADRLGRRQGLHRQAPRRREVRERGRQRPARDDRRRRRLLDQPRPRPEPEAEPVAGLVAFFGNIVGAADVLAGKATTASGIKVIDPTTVEFDLSTPTRRSSTSSRRRSPRSCPRSSPATTRRPSRRSRSAPGRTCSKSYTKGQGATFVKNPAYWQAGPAVPRRDRLQDRPGRQRDAPADRGRDARHDGRPAAGRPSSPR